MTSTVIVINVRYATAKQRMIQGNYRMTGIMKPNVMFISLLVWDFKNFWFWVFVVQHTSSILSKNGHWIQPC